jgi:hypothetical protein
MSNTRSKAVERNWPATAAEDELRLQGEFPGFLRATAVNKVAGLSRELVVAAYRAEWSRSAEALAGMAPSDRSRRAAGDQIFTVRWILTHLIQETARHVGHLDFLRELAGGETGE